MQIINGKKYPDIGEGVWYFDNEQEVKAVYPDRDSCLLRGRITGEYTMNNVHRRIRKGKPGTFGVDWWFEYVEYRSDAKDDFIPNPNVAGTGKDKLVFFEWDGNHEAYITCQGCNEKLYTKPGRVKCVCGDEFIAVHELKPPGVNLAFMTPEKITRCRACDTVFAVTPGYHNCPLCNMAVSVVGN